MNDQFKVELQALLARYPDVQGVTVRMVQTFEVKASDPKITYTTGYAQIVHPEEISNPTMAALAAGVNEIIKSK